MVGFIGKFIYTGSPLAVPFLLYTDGWIYEDQRWNVDSFIPNQTAHTRILGDMRFCYKKLNSFKDYYNML